MPNKRTIVFVTLLTLTSLVLLGSVPHTNITAHAAATVGTVCIAQSGTNDCPLAPVIITGGTSGTLTIAVNIAGSDSMGGAQVSVVTDPAVLSPVSISTTGTVIPAGFTLVNCINGAPAPGASCETGIDGVGVASYGQVGLSVTVPPTTGLLFTVTYTITGTTTSSPIGFVVNSQCSTQSVSLVVPGDSHCILITSGAATVPENVQTATFINSATFIEFVSPTFLQVTTGNSVTSTINATSILGFNKPVALTSSINATTNLPTITFVPTSIPLSNTIKTGTSTLTFSTTSPTQAGGYNVTVTGTGGPPSQTRSVFIIVKVVAAPSVSTTLSSNPITVGNSVRDSATLAGASSTAGGSVTYNLFSATGCTDTSLIFSQIVTVSAGVAPSSRSIPINSTGLWSWNATYSGDTYNLAALSPCEPLTVNQASPTISTTLSSASIVVGNTATDTATIMNGFFGPAVGSPFSSIVGNVTYNLFFGSVCSGTSNLISFVPVNGNTGSVPASRSVVFNSTGTWSWNATYTGDSNNNKALSTCEPLTVQPATPIITTTLSANSIGVGGSASDTATLTGGYNPTGTITYYLFVDGTGDCTGTSHVVTTVTVSSSGVQTSSSAVVFNNTVTKRFGWNATYTGDSNNNKAQSGCEILTVTATQDFGISSSQSALTIQLGTTGTFTVTVTSINLFSGSVTITNSTTPLTGLRLACSPNPVPVTASTPGTSTCTFTANSAGSYSVTITGTSTTPSATHSIVPDITVTVPKAAPSLATIVNTPTIVLSSTPPTTTDTATLSGGFNPTGTIVFKVFGPNDNTCTGPPVTLSSLTVNGNHAYTSSAFAPSKGVGTYQFAVTYGGDGNNTLFTATCGTETLTVSKAAPAVTTQIFNATSNTPVALTDGAAIVTLHTSVYDTATISGAFSVTGSVTYKEYNGNACSGSAFSFPVTILNGNVPNLGASTLPAFAAGNYSFTAVYGGDGNNTGTTSSCEILTVNALPVASFTITPPTSFYTVGTILNFNSTNSHDPDATALADKIVVYTWYFGEGTPVTLSTNAIVTHTYNTAGSYVVTLTVIDRYDGMNSTSFTIKVNLPEVTIVSAKLSTTTPTIGDTVTLTVDIQNTGSVALSFNVTMDVNGVTVDQQQVTLAAGQEINSITLHWNTAGYTAQSYTVTTKLVDSRLNDPSGTPVTLATSSQAAGTAALQPQPPPPITSNITFWIIVGVVVAVAAVAGAVLVLRRRKTVAV